MSSSASPQPAGLLPNALLADLEPAWVEREEEARQLIALGYNSTGLALRLYSLEIRLKTLSPPMALKTSLRPIVRKIAEAVAGFAASQELSKDDYALVGAWDEKTDRISLVFGTERRIDERQWYSGILETIRQAFATEPWRVRDIGLVVENVQSVDDVYRQFSVDDDRYDVTDMIERS